MLCNLTLGKAERVSGIALEAENIIECYNASNLEGGCVSGIIADGRRASGIVNCYNKGRLTGGIAAGIRDGYN